MFEILNRLFNWKKYPASVFFIALPLVIVGFCSQLLLAILKLVNDGDPWFLVIFIAGLCLLVFALWPIRKFIFDELKK